jgi:hypothetical protein
LAIFYAAGCSSIKGMGFFECSIGLFHKTTPQSSSEAKYSEASRGGAAKRGANAAVL